MSEKAERLAERANAKVLRARALLDEAVGLAEEIEDWYAAGRLDAAIDVLDSADFAVQVAAPKPSQEDR